MRERRGLPSKVLIARHAVEKGNLLTDVDLTWAEIPGKVDPELHFLKASDSRSHLRGALLMSAVTAGQPILRSDLVRPTDNRFIPLALRSGHRAISVAIAPNTAVAGFVTPGDLVDVIFTDTVDDQSSGRRSEAAELERGGGDRHAGAVDREHDRSDDRSADGGRHRHDRSDAGTGGTDHAGRRHGQADAGVASASEGAGAVSEDKGAQPLRLPQLLYTTDMEMSRGLQGLVTGTSSNAGRKGMVVIRGTARSVMPADDR